MGYKNFLTGIITATFLSLVVFFPKSQFRPGFSPGWESAVVVFIHAVLIWVVIEQVLKSKWINKLSYKVLLSVFIGVLIVFTIQRVFVDLANWELFSLDSSIPQRRVFVFTFFRGVVITLFLFFIEYLLFIIKETERLKRDAESIKQENLEAKLFALQQQINPHFLFNALNTLHSIAPDAETKKYVLNFSNVFRYQLNQNRTLLASLKDELEFTMAYLHILKERFEDGLIIDIDIPSECLGRKTPPVAMQMLIENAIKHNVLSEEFPLHLKIFVKDNYLVVSNNIQHKDTMETSTGIGLHNISERYRLMSENDVIISDYSKTFTVKLPLI